MHWNVNYLLSSVNDYLTKKIQLGYSLAFFNAICYTMPKALQAFDFLRGIYIMLRLVTPGVSFSNHCHLLSVEKPVHQPCIIPSVRWDAYSPVVMAGNLVGLRSLESVFHFFFLPSLPLLARLGPSGNCSETYLGCCLQRPLFASFPQ